MGALGCGDAPHGSRWRCRCGEQEEAPRLRREAAYIPLDLTGCPQQSGPGSTGRANSRQRAVLVMPGGCAPVLAHVPDYERNPRGSPDFLAYPVPKACGRRVLGTWVPRCLGAARSAWSPKAAQILR